MPKTVAYGYEGDGHSPAEIAQGLAYLNYWANADYTPSDLPAAHGGLRMPEPDQFVRPSVEAVRGSGYLAVGGTIQSTGPATSTTYGPETFHG